MRDVFVISDLHIGGSYSADGNGRKRGFRLCTHVDSLTRYVSAIARRSAENRAELVINGDLVDFLAEEGGAGPRWTPFVTDEGEACRRLDRIVERDAAFFEALRDLLRRGHRLTILLGNHDIELALPAVRSRLDKILGVESGARFRLIYDGEAYVIGDVLIEHGNRYDGFNVVDHDRLRRLRSLQSRHMPVDENVFEAPPGSRLVAEIMNPLKEDYPFIDLLKPETEAAVPLLLALRPDYRRRLAEIVSFALEARSHRPHQGARPTRLGDISSASAPSGTLSPLVSRGEAAGSEVVLQSTINALLGPGEADAFWRAVGVEERAAVAAPVASVGFERARGLAQLLIADRSQEIETRLPALLRAFRVLRNDRSFDPEYEPFAPFLEAALAISRRGFRVVAFGHTHLMKRIELGGGRLYCNSGAWTDLIRVPSSITRAGDAEALVALRGFCDALRSGEFNEWIEFHPTYIHLRMSAEGRVCDATIREYRDEDAV
jgi:UDP-2,3-diacylglucosamine pyrophosphatase LpxH